MMHYGMLILGIISSLFSMEGIILTFIYPPYPYGLLISAFIALFSVVFCEIAKTKILIEKMEKRAMLILILFICESLFFLILALSVLIFLSQVQEGQFSLNAKLSSFILQGNPLNFGEISWINLLFYFGNTITIGFYARQFYRMFWVNNIIHIYRYLKKRVKNLNESVTRGLPIIPLTQNLRGMSCSLCLEDYNEIQQLTKLPCQHIFHKSCIRLWVIRSNACPLCRKRAIFS